MKNKGQALVEMAIVLILLFLLVFGIFQFGWLMYIKNTLNNAARAGARAAVVTSSLTASSATAVTSSNYPGIHSTIFDSLPYVQAADVTATVQNITGNSPAVSGDTITVVVTLGNVRPFVPGLLGLGFLQGDSNNAGAYLITGRASMRYE